MTTSTKINYLRLACFLLLAAVLVNSIQVWFIKKELDKRPTYDFTDQSNKLSMDFEHDKEHNVMYITMKDEQSSAILTDIFSYAIDADQKWEGVYAQGPGATTAVTVFPSGTSQEAIANSVQEIKARVRDSLQESGKKESNESDHRGHQH